jgi:hypothetical protein
MAKSGYFCLHAVEMSWKTVVMYRGADNSQPVSTVSAWECVYATNLSRLQGESNRRHVGEAHSVLTTATLLPQRLSCYWDKIVSLRMLTNLRLADYRLTAAQQRTTGQNLPPDLYVCCELWYICTDSLLLFYRECSLAARHKYKKRIHLEA